MTSPRRRTILCRTLAGALALGAGAALAGCGGDATPPTAAGHDHHLLGQQRWPGPDPALGRADQAFEAATRPSRSSTSGCRSPPCSRSTTPRSPAAARRTSVASTALPGRADRAGGAGTARRRLGPATLNGNIDTAVLDSIKASATDGKLYMVPTSANLDILWYRTDLFEAAGLKPPGTWEDFFAASDQADRPRRRTSTASPSAAGPASTAELLTSHVLLLGHPRVLRRRRPVRRSPTRRTSRRSRRSPRSTAPRPPRPTSTTTTTRWCAQFDGGTAAMMHHNLGS